MLRQYLAVIVLLICTVPARAEDAQLAARVDHALAANRVRRSEAGIKIISVRTGETFIDNNGKELFIPASNAKLLTTAAALRVLGPDYQFVTSLYARGLMAEGILQGDLVVIGGGDPEISGRHHDDPKFLFAEWAQSLKSKGITAVQGNLIGDDSAFDDQYVHPEWPENQLGEWYCAPVSALSLNDNCLDITVTPGTVPGSPAMVEMIPWDGYTTIDNRCVTTADKSEHVYGFLGKAGTKDLVLRGKFWTDGYPAPTSIPVEDPSLFFLRVMRKTLTDAGISITGDIRLSHQPVPVDNAELVATHETPVTLAVEVADKRSQNFYAEQILKTLGRRMSGKGSFESGASAVEQFISRISTYGAECEISDGSGLSRKNKVSAAAMVDVLQFMANSPEADEFAGALPISGIDGTLARRFKTEPYRGRVRGKTGTLIGVSALSGYIEVPGDTLAFSILMNSRRVGVWRMRKAQDAICEEVIDTFINRSAVDAEVEIHNADRQPELVH